VTAEGLKPFTIDRKGKEVELIWSPLNGSQTMFLSCDIEEAIYEGTRGPGKTDALLMDFFRDVGKGWGSAWTGVLFRRTFPELSDVIEKSKKWFNELAPGAKYNEAKSEWRFKGGERLLFRHFLREADYWSYHGHAYPWIGWEELTTWPDMGGYKRMKSCSRSPRKGMPKRVRSTTNPYGPGHNVVKDYFGLPISGNKPFHVLRGLTDKDVEAMPDRAAFRGRLLENTILLHADPGYITRLRSAARSEAELKAWMEGDWNIVAGGMFDDVWDDGVHVFPRLPWNLIPSSWRIDRSFDWGSSRPFSVGWWAESDGTDLLLPNGRWQSTIRGDLIRVQEWYGWNGEPNEGIRALASDIAKGIKQREKDWGIHGRVRPGVADSSIFDVENGTGIARDMARRVRLDSGENLPGVKWIAADKRPGSRKLGWERMREMFTNAKRGPNGEPREHPGLFVTEDCRQFLRTVPVLTRSDRDPDDVNTETEDHIGDETRYRVRSSGRRGGQGKHEGMT
jgi:hypothetical protein